MSIIDVAVPCYQYGRFLKDCVASITSQNVDDLRIRIIDNGSTDDSLTVAQELARNDNRISVAHHPQNLGQKRSYNDAIDWAASKYFMILDADDVLPPGSLQRALTVMDKNPSVAFCYGPEYAVPFAAGSQPSLAMPEAKPGWTIETGPEFVRRVCRQPINPAGATGIVVRTDAQIRAGHYTSSLDHTDDLEMWLRLACLGKVAQTEELQGVRRVHPHQLTRYFDRTYLRDCEERLAAFELFFSGDGTSLPNASALYRCAKRSLASKAYWSSLSHLARGYASTSLALMKFAVGHCPIMAVVPPLDWLARTERPWKRVTSVCRRVLSASLQSRRGTQAISP